ncbi:MAG: MerR family transcriptional regulator [Planctomycetes bacterium]|nr:MerR family transcriptional regulator [Planctomycetota bacterium]
MPTSNQFSIHDAAAASGLTPSVIRVWEERYGWPAPKRHRNGYRAFAAHEIDELKRVAELVKNGMPISKIIVDGFPHWPEEGHRSAPRHDVTVVRGLPLRPGRAAEGLREEIARSLEDLHVGHALEAIQRACIDLRPADELAAVLAPALVGLVELRSQGRHLPRENELEQAIGVRCRQLRQRLPTSGAALAVGALNESTDVVFADLVVALLAARGIAARRSDPSEAEVVASVSVPAGTRSKVHLTPLPCEGCVPVAQLLDDATAVSALLSLSHAPALAS